MNHKQIRKGKIISDSLDVRHRFTFMLLLFLSTRSVYLLFLGDRPTTWLPHSLAGKVSFLASSGLHSPPPTARRPLRPKVCRPTTTTPRFTCARSTNTEPRPAKVFDGVSGRSRPTHQSESDRFAVKLIFSNTRWLSVAQPLQRNRICLVIRHNSRNPRLVEAIDHHRTLD